MSESLILAVQDHEMLYAPSHREYKNAKKKLLVWDMIGVWTEYGQTVPATFGSTGRTGRRNCAIHARVCGILHGEHSSVVSRAPRHVVGVYFVAFVAVSTPTKATKDLAFPAAIVDDALRWLRQRDKAVNSFAYRSLFTASLSPDVNATAGGKISRRAIYRRNNA